MVSKKFPKNFQTQISFNPRLIVASFLLKLLLISAWIYCNYLPIAMSFSFWRISASVISYSFMEKLEGILVTYFYLFFFRDKKDFYWLYYRLHRKQLATKFPV